MHLVYVDESGNTGNNLDDPAQPVFVLGALIVPEDRWQVVERAVDGLIALHAPEVHRLGAELHAADLRTGKGAFKGIPVDRRLALRDALMALAARLGLKFVSRQIVKRQYRTCLLHNFGSGLVIHPYVPAFLLMSRVVNQYLADQNALGMFISDENKDVVRTIENSIRVLRLEPGPLQLSQIIEKVFFIDSRESRVLQLCDLCSMYARKQGESITSGKAVKPIDEGGVTALDAMRIQGPEMFVEVTSWLIQWQKRGVTK